MILTCFFLLRCYPIKLFWIQVYKNFLLCNTRIAFHLHASWPQVTCFYTSYDHLCVISGKMRRNARVSLQSQPTTQKVSSSTLIRDLIFEGKKQKTLPEDRLFVEPPLPFIISLSILSCFPSKNLISYDGSWNSRGYHVMWATDQNKTYLFSTCFMAYLVRNLGEIKLQSFLIY